MAEPGDASQQRLLVVCTANVCRSPLAQRVLQRVFADSSLSGIRVESAGTRGMTGAPMCPVSAADLGDEGFAAGHVAREIERDLVVGAGLVLTMEREHRSAVARLAPGSQATVFTLREARALAAVLEERGTTVAPDPAALAAALHGVRGLAVLPAPEPSRRRWFRPPVELADPLTIVDGHGAAIAEHEAAVREVDAVTTDVARALVRITGG